MSQTPSELAPTSFIKKHRTRISLLSILYVFSLLYNLGSYPLQFEEPYRALVGLEMALNDNYIHRTAFGVPDYEKPPVWNWILAGFGEAFDWEEWALRLPTVLSLLGFVWITFWWVRRETGSAQKAFWAASALAISGQPFFFYSFLAELNLFHSLVTFLSIALFYTFQREGKILLSYAAMYGFAAIGFLTFGIPSIAHVFITLLGYALWSKSIRFAFHWKHLLGSLAFLVPVVAYFGIYSLSQPVGPFLQGLLGAVQARVNGIDHAGYPVSKYISHFFNFPLTVISQMAPVGILMLLGVIPKVRKAWWQDDFSRLCFWMFTLHLALYLLSPDARPRYVYMVYPFGLWLALAVGNQYIHLFQPLGHWLAKVVVPLLGLSAIVFVCFFSNLVPFPIGTVELGVMVAVGTCMILAGAYVWVHPNVWGWVAILCVVLLRFSYDAVGVPYRDNTGTKNLFPRLADEILEEYPNHTVFVYQRDPNGSAFTYPMATLFYLTQKKMEIIRPYYGVPEEDSTVVFVNGDYSRFERGGYTSWKDLSFRGTRKIMTNTP